LLLTLSLLALISSQCVTKGRECVFVKSRRGGARKKKDSNDGEQSQLWSELRQVWLTIVATFFRPSVPLPPNALAMFLKQLDGMMAPPPDMPPDMSDMNLSREPEQDVDPAIVLRSFKPDDADGM
jgi:hypothetical protein